VLLDVVLRELFEIVCLRNDSFPISDGDGSIEILEFGPDRVRRDASGDTRGVLIGDTRENESKRLSLFLAEFGKSDWFSRLDVAFVVLKPFVPATLPEGELDLQSPRLVVLRIKLPKLLDGEAFTHDDVDEDNESAEF